MASVWFLCHIFSILFQRNEFLKLKGKKKGKRKKDVVENSSRLNYGRAFFEEVKVEKYACQPEPLLSAFLVPDIERSRRREFFRSALSDAHQAKRVRRFIYGCQTHTGVTVNAILNEAAWCCFASEGEIQTALGAAFQILHSVFDESMVSSVCLYISSLPLAVSFLFLFFLHESFFFSSVDWRDESCVRG